MKARLWFRLASCQALYSVHSYFKVSTPTPSTNQRYPSNWPVMVEKLKTAVVEALSSTVCEVESRINEIMNLSLQTSYAVFVGDSRAQYKNIGCPFQYAKTHGIAFIRLNSIVDLPDVYCTSITGICHDVMSTVHDMRRRALGDSKYDEFFLVRESQASSILITVTILARFQCFEVCLE
jgi:hypothetical protein